MGSPLSNTKGFVLNKSMQMLPMRAVGELYLTGDCVTRGYLNRPEMTAERFLPNPFQTDEEKKQGKNGRLYKTGDLVRWRFDGELEYLCRNDLQVKIRGLRIELGEIEAVLSSYQGVKQSVVIATDAKTVDGEERIRKYLVGYYVSDNEIYESDLKEYMETKLPDYMIPNRLMQLEKIPVTTSGKLDVKALPDIDFSVGENNYCAPRNELEAKLCAIWSDLLVVEKVGITDDFFRLGGDSIGSLRLISRMRKELGLCVSIRNIFGWRTIKKLYERVIRDAAGKRFMGGVFTDFQEEGELYEEVQLLPVHEWFLMKHSVGINHWNQCFLIETPNLDMEQLKVSVTKLIAHHDAFKLRFKLTIRGTYTQCYDSSLVCGSNFPLNHLDIRSLEQSEDKDRVLNDILTEWQSHFDIEKGPLYAFGYLYGFPENKARIWFAMHHLIVNAGSWRIICEDLWQLYDGQSQLDRKGSSYREWSQLVQSYALQASAAEESYWQNLVSNVSCFNDGLSKHKGISENTLALITTSFKLSTVETCSLLRDCSRVYSANIQVLLLTALGYALKDLTRNQINYVALEINDQEEIDCNNVDISRTVGWLTTMFPILLDIDDNLRRSIMNVEAHLMQVPNKGIGYGKIVGYKNQDLPCVSFNYLGQFESASPTTAGSISKNNRWYLINGIVGDERVEKVDDGNVIAVNGFCMEGQMRFNITSILNSEITTQFANSFKSKLTDIVLECFGSKSLVEMNYSSDFEHPFELLNANANKILFVLPPINGGAESYFNNIVPHLSPYKLVLFNNYYHKLKVKHMEKGLSFETLARLYVKYIKQIQYKGPYNLLGWSFGGVLSFEISRQLNNAGDEIGNIFMIDSCFNMNKVAFEIYGKREMDIIDEINYSYLPNIDNEPFGLNISNMNIKIVLFKANQIHNDDLSSNRLELLKYYTNTAFNCLDTIVAHKYIRLIVMLGQSHTSWISSKEQIVNICNYIASILK
ncbi:unnamed protein product [Rotaria magnacalcarata]